MNDLLGVVDDLIGQVQSWHLNGGYMSEVIVTGAAGVAIGACVAAATLVASAALVTYKALSWLSAEAVAEMEKLERTLAAPLTQPTTREARQEFQEKLANIRQNARRNPLLRPHADSIAAMLAVRNSALGRFVTADDVRALTRPHLARPAVDDLLEDHAGPHEPRGDLFLNGRRHRSRKYGRVRVQGGTIPPRVNTRRSCSKIPTAGR